MAVLPPAYMLLVHHRDRRPRGPRPGGGGPGALPARRAARPARCWSARSWRCRATTGGRPWPGPRSATTCTPCTPSSPPRCCAPPTPDDSAPARIAVWEERRLGRGGPVGRDAGGHLLRRDRRPGPRLVGPPGDPRAPGLVLTRARRATASLPVIDRGSQTVTRAKGFLTRSVVRRIVDQAMPPPLPRPVTVPDDHPPAGVHSLWRLRGYLRPAPARAGRHGRHRLGGASA